MSPKNGFMFYNTGAMPSYEFKKLTDKNRINYHIWESITPSCIDLLKIERFTTPKRIFEELLLIMNEQRHLCIYIDRDFMESAKQLYK